MIHAIFWLQIAASPTIGGIVLGLILSGGNPKHFSVPLCGMIGFFLGSFWAERVRKTVGLSAFFGRLIALPEMPDNEGNGQSVNENDIEQDLPQA